MVKATSSYLRCVFTELNDLDTGQAEPTAECLDTDLCRRLRTVLQSGAEAVDCQAASLYVLDDATTQLELQASWGLSDAQQNNRLRPLRGAIGDLEAMAGSAVVLEEDSLMEAWAVPKACGAAVCVPVATDATILGTLWVYAREPRTFSDRETNLLEIIAGRLAADLECHSQTLQQTEESRLGQQAVQAGQVQASLLPSTAPQVSGWSIAGHTEHAGKLGGSFHDWLHVDEPRLAVAAGNAAPCSITGALVGTALRTSIRTCAPLLAQPGKVLTHVGETLWSGSAGDLSGDAFYGQLNTQSGELVYATAGEVAALAFQQGRWNELSTQGEPLAMRLDHPYPESVAQLEPGEMVCIFTAGLRAWLQAATSEPPSDALPDVLGTHATRSATELVHRVVELLSASRASGLQADWTLVAVRREY